MSGGASRTQTAEICDILGHRMTNALLRFSFLGSQLRWIWLILCSSSALIRSVLVAVRIVVQKTRCLGVLNAQGSEGQQEWGMLGGTYIPRRLLELVGRSRGKRNRHPWNVAAWNLMLWVLYWCCCTEEVGLSNRAERLGTDLGDHSPSVKFRTTASFNNSRLLHNDNNTPCSRTLLFYDTICNYYNSLLPSHKDIFRLRVYSVVAGRLVFRIDCIMIL